MLIVSAVRKKLTEGVERVREKVEERNTTLSETGTQAAGVLKKDEQKTRTGDTERKQRNCVMKCVALAPDHKHIYWAGLRERAVDSGRRSSGRPLCELL